MKGFAITLTILSLIKASDIDFHAGQLSLISNYLSNSRNCQKETIKQLWNQEITSDQCLSKGCFLSFMDLQPERRLELASKFDVTQGQMLLSVD